MDNTFNTVAAQLALDYNMPLSFLLDNENHFSIYVPKEGRRLFGDNPDLFLKIAVFNGKVVATGKEEAVEAIKEMVGKRKGDWIFDGFFLSKIILFLSEYGREVEMIHPFFVKSKKSNKETENISFRIIEKEEIEQYRDDDFSEAFAFDDDAPDEIGVAIMEKGEIVSVAGASSDSPLMWQLGVDTKLEHRGKGYGTSAVEILSDIVLDKGHIPFYGTAFSHISSLNVALSSSFRPMWIELVTN